MLKQLFQDPLLSDLTKYINEDKSSQTILNKSTNKNATNTIDDSSLTAAINSLTLEQVDTLIALELGTAFEITIQRGGLESLRQKLLEDKARIQEIGIRSGSILKFSRYTTKITVANHEGKRTQKVANHEGKRKLADHKDSETKMLTTKKSEHKKLLNHEGKRKLADHEVS
ncbi:19947_t:CDS:2 [Funneliformis geosporum]|uniref:19947_t:CDS:1 n=1 Tax=Funneliformis geosporum TaxID=1117311 RepID=A0A9W4SXU9_9GLOM|nr:19947_t:CDS:2 [Funneliformis geosporum]